MEDELLNQLAQEAQRLAVAVQADSSQSLESQRALNRLVSQTIRSRRLARPQQGQWSAALYPDLWNEALSRTLLEITRRIAAYNSDYAFMAWVNSILSYRFKDVVSDYYGGGVTGIPRPEASKVGRIISLDELDQDQPAEPSEPDPLQQFILDDPEQKFTDCIRGRPQATFQFLLLARLEAQSWDEISDQLGPPPLSKQTLSSFFNRELRKLNDYFQKYLSA